MTNFFNRSTGPESKSEESPVPRKSISGLEQLVMDFVWTRGSSTAEDVRESLAADRPMKESTVRTLLRRLEEKGYLTHQVEGRTFRYVPTEGRPNVAAQAVRQIIDRFCGGSVEELLVGMVDSQVLDEEQLRAMAERISQARMAAKTQIEK